MQHLDNTLKDEIGKTEIFVMYICMYLPEWVPTIRYTTSCLLPVMNVLDFGYISHQMITPN